MMVELTTSDGRRMLLEFESVESVFEGKPLWNIAGEFVTEAVARSKGYNELVEGDPEGDQRLTQINMKSGDKGECMESYDQVRKIIMERSARPRESDI